MSGVDPLSFGGLIGRTLSHYRVTERIGAGGMGEVYRATDTNLGRDVAIKVLPAEVAGDPERLARFRREARLLAALNHPSIAAIYEIEESESGPFLALELVEGEDLKQRLDRGAIPVNEALEIALRVAEALEEAHGKGIVHRDLKPANVKVAPDGKVKVLDFGLAKAWASEAGGEGSSASALSQSPTMARGGTMAGVVLGTAACMSPEQARGKAVDKRADVWSFGVLLWEMLTGRALFTGETVTDVIAAVVSREPDLGALPATTPAAVRRLIARCLRKDARQRLPDMGAARLDLQEVIAGTVAEPDRPESDTEGRVRDALRRRRRERRVWGAVAFAATALATGLAYVHLTEAPVRPRAVRFAARPPEGWFFTPYGLPVPSPDGSQIALVARRRADPLAPALLWIRSLDSLTVRPLAGTEGANEGPPFWSPDGRFIGFFSGGELRSLTLADGAVRTICKLPEPGSDGADWGRDGAILFAAGRILRVAAAGGEPTPVTTVDAARAEDDHHAPQFLPDGRRFVFLVNSHKPENSGLYVASLDAPSERQKVAPFLHYIHASGHLLFAREGTLFAQPFDAARALPSGDAVAVATSVAAWPGYPAIGQFGVSSGGTLAYLSGRSAGGLTGQVQLAWLDRKGALIGNVGAPGSYGQIALSPDGRSAVVEMPDAELRTDLWVMDLQRGVASRVTATPEGEYDAVWSPDGRSLAFASENKDGAVEVRRKNLRANEPDTVLINTPDRDYPEAWSSAGGGTLLFLRHSGEGKSAWALPLGGGEPVKAVRTSASLVDEPQLSPDGRWIAYMSNESGRYEVYAEPFRRDGERVRVSVDGGGQPKWRGDGREFFYATPAGRVMAVEVRAAADRLEVGLPAELFQLPLFRSSGEFDDYAVSGDGQRFLVKLPLAPEKESGLELHGVANWTSLLK